MELKVEGVKIVAINEGPFELVDGVVEYRWPEVVPAPPRPPEPVVVPVADVVAMERPPANLGHSAQRWLKEAEGCGFVLLGWMSVTILSTSTAVALANADGSVVFFIYSKSYGGDFHPTGAEMCSHFAGPAEVTTSLFAIPASEPGRGIHRHSAKVSSIGELLREHLAQVARVNLSLTEAVRTGSLEDHMAGLEAEINRKLGHERSRTRGE